MASEGPWSFTVVGMLNNVAFHKAKCCAEALHQADPAKYHSPSITGLLEFEWNLYIEAQKLRLKGEMWVFEERAIVYANDELIGTSDDFLKYAEEMHNYVDFRPHALYIALADEAYKTHLASKKHDYVYLDIQIEDTLIGSLLIELFSDIVPKTCENFHALCTGVKGESETTEFKLHYANSIFHRIVKHGWIQGGDIWMKKGDGGESIFGPVFEDENFSVSHNRRGILGMANKGHHTNASQFYITLQPTPWMDTKYVAFGQIIEGTTTLKAMEEVDTINDRPLKDIVIADCGTTTFKF